MSQLLTPTMSEGADHVSGDAAAAAGTMQAILGNPEAVSALSQKIAQCISASQLAP